MSASNVTQITGYTQRINDELSVYEEGREAGIAETLAKGIRAHWPTVVVMCSASFVSGLLAAMAMGGGL